MEKVAEIAASAGKGLVPPPESDDDAHHAWRWRIFIVSCSAFIGMVCAYVLALGLIPPVFPGFARADDVRANITEQRVHWSFDIDGKILELRIKHCQATSKEARQLYWSKISELLERYHLLTGQQYNLPQCVDL